MRTALAVLSVVVLLPVSCLAARWAWLGRRERLAAWWEETVGPVLHPPRTLDVAGLQRRILVVALREVSVTDRGVAVLPERFRVVVSDDDAGRLGPLLHIVEAELADALGNEAVKRSWLRPERVRVTITAGSAVDGRPRVRAVLGPEAVEALVPGAGGPATTAPEGARLASAWPATAEPVRSHRTAQGTTGVGGLEAHATGTSGPTATSDPRGVHPAGSARTERRSSTVPVVLPAPDPMPPAGTPRSVVCELVSADGGRDIDLTHRAERLTVGRVGTAVVLDDERVSSRHAELVPAAGGQWLLDDTGSLNGTWVNGRRVERASLVHGDEVRFASSGPRFLFSRLAGAGR